MTREDMNIIKTTSSIAFPVIIEGTIYPSVLNHVNLSEAWLMQQLSEQGVNDINNVFVASINYNLELHVSLRNEDNITIPPIRH